MLQGRAQEGGTFFSIRINDQWRIVFRWQAGNAYEVRLADYH
jgi:proteic killer suppression protein